MPGLDLVDWAGILVPAATPSEAIKRLHQDISKVVRSKEIHQRWIDQGLEPRVTTSEELAATIKSDIDKWGRIVRDAGIRLE